MPLLDQINRRLTLWAPALARQLKHALRTPARRVRVRRARMALDAVFPSGTAAAPRKALRPVLFLGSYPLSSFKLGGLYLIEALDRMGVGARSGEGVALESLRDSIVVCVKERLPSREELSALKARGNRIVINLRDSYFLPWGPLNPDFVGRDLADCLIFPNRALRDKYLSLKSTSSRCEVLYGYADPAITAYFQKTGFPDREELRCCYFGFAHNLDATGLDGAAVEAVPLTESDFDRHLPRLRRCSLHVDLRPREEDRLYKPLTKVLIAAECRSNIIVERSPRVLELLPEDYPFLVEGHDARAALGKAQALFGTGSWRRALDMMAELREKHSFRNHLRRFVDILESLS